MNKSSYLRTLKTELTGLPYDDITEIIEDISEHFDVGLTNGKSEIEIINQLGSPKKLAFAYNIDSGSTNAVCKHSLLKNFLAYVGIGFSGLVGGPLLIAVIVIFGSVYIVLLALYLSSMLMIATPILKAIFPAYVQTAGLSPWLFTLGGILLIILSHFCFNWFHQFSMRLFKYSLKEPVINLIKTRTTKKFNA